MALTILSCFDSSGIENLSSLAGMPLTSLNCRNTRITDLSPLAECKELKTLVISEFKITPLSVAALQKALPNCKIEWGDPAKPKTPPAASGTK